MVSYILPIVDQLHGNFKLWAGAKSPVLLCYPIFDFLGILPLPSYTYHAFVNGIKTHFKPSFQAISPTSPNPFFCYNMTPETFSSTSPSVRINKTF